MNYRDYVCYDFETSSANPGRTQPASLAAVIIHGRTLEIKPNSGFNSLIQVVTDQEECDRLGLDKMQEGAVKVHGLSEERLASAPTLKTVWANFTEYVNEYNFRGNDFTAPVSVGYNINNFDSVIVERICSKEPWNYGPKNDKFPRGTIFHPIYSIDMMQVTHMFFENNKDVSSLSMDNLVRGYCGYDKGKGHDAMDDVIMTAELFCRFQKMIRGIAGKRKFKGSMASA